MIHILARISAKPEASAQVRAALLELLAKTRAEDGCLRYDLYQCSEAPQLFQTVEEWRDAGCADAHMKTAHVAAAFAVAGPLLAMAPEIQAFEKVG